MPELWTSAQQSPLYSLSLSLPAHSASGVLIASAWYPVFYKPTESKIKENKAEEEKTKGKKMTA